MDVMAKATERQNAGASEGPSDQRVTPEFLHWISQPSQRPREAFGSNEVWNAAYSAGLEAAAKGLIEHASHVRDNSNALRGLPGMIDEARCRLLASLYLEEAAENVSALAGKEANS